MARSGAAAGVGLLAAAAWGGSDFAGGLGSRRASALLITTSGQIVSLILLLAVCLFLKIAVPDTPHLLYSSIGGLEGALALALFYRALAMGAMGLTAALTGVLTALIPVVYQLFLTGLPAAPTAAGLAAGCAAIWLISHSPATAGAGTPPKALLLGAISGAGFGAQLILFRMAAEQGVLWALTSARIAGVAGLLVFVLFARHQRPWRGFWLAGIIAGSLDTLGNLFYILTSKMGRLDVAAVICSLYPAGTILLAALVVRERPTRRQWAGMVLALAAVGLLSL